MCVVALALHQHPDWPVILIGNRDEFHARASAPVHAWDDGSGIIAGRDLVGGGTWLGVQAGARRLVVVTNVKGERGPEADQASRGVLVRDLLTGAGEFAAATADQLGGFRGFNLLALVDGQTRLLTNRPAPLVRDLRDGIHALANEVIDDNAPRATRLNKLVEQWRGSGHSPQMLLDQLAAGDAPPLFLNDSVYGTRCSTLVAIGKDGRGEMIERRFGPSGAPIGERCLIFGWGG